MPEYADVPPHIFEKLRAICLALPDAYEEQAWTGRRWRVRKRTITHVYTIDSDTGPTTMIQFRAEPDEMDVLVRAGHPYYRAGWGSNVMAMVLDGDTDWDEVAEVLTESYCVLAPKKLVALVDRPGA